MPGALSKGRLVYLDRDDINNATAVDELYMDQLPITSYAHEADHLASVKNFLKKEHYDRCEPSYVLRCPDSYGGRAVQLKPLDPSVTDPTRCGLQKRDATTDPN